MCNMPNEELFTATVKRIEAELNAIKGIAADTASKHPSRTEGPQYSWKTLCGRCMQVHVHLEVLETDGGMAHQGSASKDR